MEYVSSWKSSLWETDPEAGLHSYKALPQSSSHMAGRYATQMWECTKCGALLETGYNEPLKPPSPKWGPHCAELQIKRVIDG